MVYVNPADVLMRAPPAIEPVLLASLAHCMLQGIIFCQMVSFWRRRAADNWRLKSFVLTLFTLCLIQTVGQIYKVWVVVVSQRNWAEHPARYVEFPLNCVICSAVQAFLVKRVWKVSGRRWIVLVPLAALLLIISAAGVTMALTVSRLAHKQGVNKMACHSVACLPEFSAWLWSSAALDATITIALSVYFVRSKTGFHHLDAVITRIWNLTLITAALPMAIMLAAVSLFYATGGKHYHTVTALIIIAGKLYFNGLLRNLNVRAILKASLDANTLGQRSIVTVGSANMRCKNAATENTSMDGIASFDDLEKGPVREGRREGCALPFVGDSPQIYDADAEAERGGLFMLGLDVQTRFTPPSRSVRQFGTLYHSVTF